MVAGTRQPTVADSLAGEVLPGDFMLKLHAILVIALASSACADTPHSGTTDRSSTPLGSAPENRTHSLPGGGAASTMRLSAMHFHGPKPHEYFAHEASKKISSTHKGRRRDPFWVFFDLCDMRDRKSAALIPRQPGCMAFSHRYREELAKVASKGHSLVS